MTSRRDMRHPDTIAAVATAAGEGGIGIVRISGPDAPAIGDRVFRGRGGRPLSAAPPLRLTRGSLVAPGSGEIIDEVLAVLMPPGRSYTGEATVEIQAHGGPAVLEAILGEVLAAGARAAQPGEFTQRAFLGGRIDLAQAEAVAELIAARSSAARRRAIRQLQGRAGELVRELRHGLIDCLAHGEALIDFGEEEGMTDPLPVTAMADAARGIGRLLEEGRAEARGAEGRSVVFIGPPNSGKSSIFNVLCDIQRSIVTPEPGTTRDYVEERALLRGIRVLLTDTAGVRETRDQAEAEGVRRGLARAREANLVLLVVDGSLPASRETLELARELAERTTIVVVTKSDLARQISRGDLGEIAGRSRVINVSAVTGEGCDELAREIADRCRAVAVDAGDTPAFNRRQLAALERAASSLDRALGRDTGAAPPLDQALLEVRLALDALGEITGESAGDEVLERIFSRFCIGK